MLSDEIISKRFFKIHQYYGYRTSLDREEDIYIKIFKLSKITADYIENNNDSNDNLAYLHAYKLFLYFGLGTKETILNRIESFLNQHATELWHHPTPTHQLLLPLISKNEPKMTPNQLMVWQKLIQKEGLIVLTLFENAPLITQVFQDNLPRTIEEIQFVNSLLKINRSLILPAYNLAKILALAERQLFVEHFFNHPNPVELVLAFEQLSLAGEDKESNIRCLIKHSRPKDMLTALCNLYQHGKLISQEGVVNREALVRDIDPIFRAQSIIYSNRFNLFPFNNLFIGETGAKNYEALLRHSYTDSILKILFMFNYLGWLRGNEGQYFFQTVIRHPHPITLSNVMEDLQERGCFSISHSKVIYELIIQSEKLQELCETVCMLASLKIFQASNIIKILKHINPLSLVTAISLLRSIPDFSLIKQISFNDLFKHPDPKTLALEHLTITTEHINSLILQKQKYPLDESAFYTGKRAEGFSTLFFDKSSSKNNYAASSSNLHTF